MYLGGLDENTTEEQLRNDVSGFGLIGQVKIVRNKTIGFVHFLNIIVATEVRLIRLVTGYPRGTHLRECRS